MTSLKIVAEINAFTTEHLHKLRKVGLLILKQFVFANEMNATPSNI